MQKTTFKAPPAADDQAKELVEKPPADSPIESTWSVFERMAVSANFPDTYRRFLKHAFYAGARASFSSVIDSFEETDAGDPEGEKRFAAIEVEIDKYFTELMKAAAVAPNGQAS